MIYDLFYYATASIQGTVYATIMQHTTLLYSWSKSRTGHSTILHRWLSCLPTVSRTNAPLTVEFMPDFLTTHDASAALATVIVCYSIPVL